MSETDDRRERWRKRARAYYLRNRQTLCQKSVDNRRKLMADVKRLLGGRCGCCGEDILEFLTLDHAKGDGGGFGRRSHYYAYMEVRRAFDSGEESRISAVRERFRCLCWSCNVSASKGEGICAHARGGARVAAPSEWARMTREKVAFAKWQLGDECACCGENIEEFLEIDHIDGTGYLVPRGGFDTRRHLTYYMEVERAFRGKDEAAIQGVRARYQVLCACCNFSKHQGAGVCFHARSPLNHAKWPYRRDGAAPLCG